MIFDVFEWIVDVVRVC